MRCFQITTTYPHTENKSCLSQSYVCLSCPIQLQSVKSANQSLLNTYLLPYPCKLHQCSLLSRYTSLLKRYSSFLTGNFAPKMSLSVHFVSIHRNFSQPEDRVSVVPRAPTVTSLLKTLSSSRSYLGWTHSIHRTLGNIQESTRIAGKQPVPIVSS